MPPVPGFIVLSSVLKTFMACDGSGSSGAFVWENRFKLKSIEVIGTKWEVASVFGKGRKGMKMPEIMKSDGDVNRQVMYRDITGTSVQRINIGYDLEYEWVEKVDKDMI
jgi:hypothetical protein